MYPCPEPAAERRDMLANVNVRLEDLITVSEGSRLVILGQPPGPSPSGSCHLERRGREAGIFAVWSGCVY